MASINFAADGTSSISFSLAPDQFDPVQFEGFETGAEQRTGAGSWQSSSQDTYERSPRAHEPTERQREYKARFDAMSPVARALLLTPELGQYVPVSQHRHVQNHYEWGGTYIAAPRTKEANTSDQAVVLPGYPHDGWKCTICDLHADKLSRVLAWPQDAFFGILFGARPPWAPSKDTPCIPAGYHVAEGEPLPRPRAMRLITVDEARAVSEAWVPEL